MRDARKMVLSHRSDPKLAIAASCHLTERKNDQTSRPSPRLSVLSRPNYPAPGVPRVHAARRPRWFIPRISAAKGCAIPASSELSFPHRERVFLLVA